MGTIWCSPSTSTQHYFSLRDFGGGNVAYLNPIMSLQQREWYIDHCNGHLMVIKYTMDGIIVQCHSVVRKLTIKTMLLDEKFVCRYPVLLPINPVDVLLQRGDFQCPICLDAIKSQVHITKCTHLFHKDCIRGYEACPMCRVVLV